MNKYTRILILLALVALLVPEFAISQADSGSITWEELRVLYGIPRHRSTWLPLDVFMEPSPVPSKPGEVSIRLTVVAYDACDEVRFEVSKIQNLEFLGPDISNFSIAQHDTVIFYMGVDVPANDTSGLEIYIFCDQIPHHATIWFETWSDSISWSVSPPWGPYGHPDTQERRTRRPREGPRPEPEPRKGPTFRTGFEDSLGNFILTDSLEPGMVLGFYDQDSNFVRVPNPADSVIVRPGRRKGQERDSTRAWAQDSAGIWHYADKDSLRNLWEQDVSMTEQDRLEKRMAKMRELEKTPLTDFTTQTFSVGDRIYSRKEGEYNFIEVTDRRTPPDHHWRDSVEAVSGRTREYTLDLRKQEHYELAASGIDSLIPTDSVGFYRAHLTRAQVRTLEDEGIILRRTRDKPGRQPTPRPANDTQSPDHEGSAPQGLMQLPPESVFNSPTN